MRDDVTAMDGVLVIPCWVCGNLCQFYVDTKAELRYFHSVGPSCRNKLRKNYEQDIGCAKEDL